MCLLETRIECAGQPSCFFGMLDHANTCILDRETCRSVFLSNNDTVAGLAAAILARSQEKLKGRPGAFVVAIAAVGLAKEVEAMQASLDQREKSLAELIIQQNPLPSDRYAGGDRDQVVAVAVDAWKHQQKDFEVLASRIPSEVWSRETLWQYSNGTWYYVDRSRLQVQLLVADEKDDSLAKILPINIWKDHQKGDAMIGTPIFSGDEVLQPSSYLLREKIR